MQSCRKTLPTDGSSSWTPCSVSYTFPHTPGSLRTGEVLADAPCARLATGGSALQAIEVLIKHGVSPQRILFLNLVASPEGLDNVWKK